jgi:hypothetical protein
MISPSLLKTIPEPDPETCCIPQKPFCAPTASMLTTLGKILFAASRKSEGPEIFVPADETTEPPRINVIEGFSGLTSRLIPRAMIPPITPAAMIAIVVFVLILFITLQVSFYVPNWPRTYET